MEWRRWKSIGSGSFGSVDLAITRGDCSMPELMAVKSAVISDGRSSSFSLLHSEKQILCHLRDCPGIVRCLGDDYTIENGNRTYNVFLEYASRGTLADLVNKSGRGGLPESDVRRFTKSILIGLRCIHEKGFVHCDIKPQNILVFSAHDGTDEVKIADFGLAKKAGAVEDSNLRGDLRGTPLFISPESIACNQNEAPGDLWSLGCVVAEMFMGRPAWNCRTNTEACSLLFRIGFGNELPEIPEEMSELGKDFLGRCFVRDTSQRWTAEMLLHHPFVADDIDEPSSSQSSAFDFPGRSSIQSIRQWQSCR